MYQNDGEYLVCLTVTSEDSCVSNYCDVVSVKCQSPVPTSCEAQFMTLSSDSCRTVVFTDLSSSSVKMSEWHYDFGDGSTSKSQHPIHMYQNDGEYLVCLTITSEDSCVSNYCDVVSVKCQSPVPSSCQAQFSFLADSCMTVSFTDASTTSAGASEWQYDFGDGATSESMNPTHNYQNDGYYNVCLTIKTQDSCVSTYCDTVQVSCASGVEWIKAAYTKLYPNPVSSKLMIESEEKLLSYQITSLKGDLLGAGQLNAGQRQLISVDHLKQGMYFIHIQSSKGYQTLQFIKN